jgi:hypothetical protein
MMDQGMHVLSQQLLRRIAQHLRSAAIDEGEPALHIHAPDAVTDRVQNRLMLARQCMEFLFGLRLLGNVDAVAEHKRIHARQLQQLVAIGDDAQLARLSPQIKASLVILIRSCFSAAKYASYSAR